MSADWDDWLADVVAAFGADSGTLHALAGEGVLHLVAAVPEMPDEVMEKIQVIPVGKGMAGLAVARGEPVDACNLQTDDSGDVRPGARLTGLQGAIVVPVRRDGTVVGALGIANHAERRFTDAEIADLAARGRAAATLLAGG